MSELNHQQGTMELHNLLDDNLQQDSRATAERHSNLRFGERIAQKIRLVRFKPAVQNTLKSWGLHSLYRLLRTVHNKLTPQSEDAGKTHKKVVIFRSRPKAFLASAIHLLPIIATAVMSNLIFQERWIGSTLSPAGKMETETDLLLQFVAKFLELFIVASLGKMMFTFIRSELAAKGVPLAAILAATDFKSPSFIWSDEFFAMMMAPFSSIWKKVFLLLFTIICALLATIIAPATATILLPRQDWYTMGGTAVYINATDEELFPKVITANHTLIGGICDIAGASHCPSAAWESLKHLAAYFPSQKVISDRDGVMWLLPETFPLPTLQARLLMSIRTRHPFATEDEGSRFHRGFSSWVESLLSLPHHTSAAALMGTQNYWGQGMRIRGREIGYDLRGSDYRFTSRHLVAVLQTRCQAMMVGPNDSFLGEELVIFPNITSGGVPYTNASMLHPTIQAFMTGLNRTVPQLVFFDLDPADQFARRVSIGSVVSIPVQNNSLEIYGCFTNARWRSEALTIKGDQPIHGELWPFNAKWGEDITIIHSSFANLTNPQVDNTDARVFQRLAEAARLSEEVEKRLNWTFGPVETIINGMLGNGMARTAPYASPIWNLKDANGSWWLNFFSHRGAVDSYWSSNNTAFDVPDEDRARLAKLDFVGETFGYYFSSKDTTAKNLIIGFFVYCAVAGMFIIWSLWSGITSSSWESTPELMALAMRSYPPEDGRLQTSVLEDLTALKQVYRVVADAQGNVRLVARSDIQGDESVIEPNKKYQ